MIHNKLEWELIVNLQEVLAVYRQGIRLIFPDIDTIQKKMEEALDKKIVISLWRKIMILQNIFIPYGNCWHGMMDIFIPRLNIGLMAVNTI
ncbi:MAG: hypothetical protein K2O40_01620 [Lachnospiraceae bacterium]|nr:hypothetical protein [Lachnospiraceae bacterium]